MRNRFVLSSLVAVSVLACTGCTGEDTGPEPTSTELRSTPWVDSTAFCQEFDEQIVRITADDFGTYVRALFNGTVVLDDGETGLLAEYSWEVVCNYDEDDDVSNVQFRIDPSSGEERWMTVERLASGNAVITTTKDGTDELSVFQVGPGTSVPKQLLYGVSVFGNEGWEAIVADEQRGVLREVQCAPFLGLNFRFEKVGA